MLLVLSLGYLPNFFAFLFLGFQRSRSHLLRCRALTYLRIWLDLKRFRQLPPYIKSALTCELPTPERVLASCFRDQTGSPHIHSEGLGK